MTYTCKTASHRGLVDRESKSPLWSSCLGWQDAGALGVSVDDGADVAWEGVGTAAWGGFGADQ